MAYLTPTQYKLRSLLPQQRIEAIQATAPEWLSQELSAWSRRIDAQLAKRYAVPFAESDPPHQILLWLTQVMDLRCLLKTGVTQQDEQFDVIRQDAESAKKELDLAANSETGLYELPLRASTSATGISRGNPLSYSEASPYVQHDVQMDRGRAEDRDRRGSYG